MANLVFCDLDGTLILKQTQSLFAKTLYLKGYVKKRDLLRISAYGFLYKMGLFKSSIAIRREMYALLSGLHLEQARDIVAEMFESLIIPNVNTKMLRLLERHKANGDRLVLQTGSLEIICLPIVSYFHFDECFSTKLEVVDKKFTGNWHGDILEGESKASCFLKYLKQCQIKPSRTYAYCDSVSDLPLMISVDEPIAVNPDMRLRVIAKNKGWKIV